MRERYGSAKLKELCCLKDWPSDGIERSIKSDEALRPHCKGKSACLPQHPAVVYLLWLDGSC